MINLSENICDFYRITGSDFAVSFGIFFGFGLVGVQFNLIDFNSKEKIACSETSAKVGVKFDYSEKGDNASFKSKTAIFNITDTENEKRLYCKFEKAFRHTDMEADIRFVINNGSDKYENFQPIFSATGLIKTRGRVYELPDKGTCGFVIKENRQSGKRTPCCLNFQSLIDDLPFSLCASSGEGVAVVYGEKKRYNNFVTINVPKDGITGIWQIVSSDGNIEAEFKPFFNDRIDFNNVVISEHSNNLYGKLKGTVTFCDGTEVIINDVGFIKLYD